MRDQLHLMELVDNYLDGTMNNTDRAAFEERLRTNEELRSLVEDQQRLRRAARRSPVRAEAKKASRKYRWGKMWPGISAGLVLLIAATVAMFVWNGNLGTNESERIGSNETVLRTLADTTGTHLDTFVITIDPTRDTTLATPGGIVLDIPKGAFVDSLGAAISSPVRVTVMEALDPLDIMKAGLSTMSGATLLETGGMFYLDAQANGNAVKIDPAKPLTVMVPATKGQSGMQLYAGVKAQDGSIDWRDPKPLKKSLVPVDIKTLDFYPPRYLEKIADLGQDATKKAFTDSLYWSFSPDVKNCLSEGVYTNVDSTFHPTSEMYRAIELGAYLFANNCASCHRPDRDLTGPALAGARERWVDKGDIRAWVKNPTSLIKTENKYANDLFRKWNKSVMTSHDLSDHEIDMILTYVDNSVPDDVWRCGIDPAKVSAIWNDSFNRTNLATREFGERMREIHLSCDERVLDLYVSNLEKDLSQVDSMAVRLGHGTFASFALENDGRVDLPTHAADRLRTYYENQSRAEAEAIRKTQEKFWNEQRKQDVRSNAKQADHAMTESVREGELFQKEFEANLDTVYKQLGIQRIRLPRSAWVVPVVSTGWWNVDKAVLEATATRSSMSYTDDKTGKTAKLTYTPLTVQVADRSSYDQLVIYLLPKQLNSYQRMKEEGGIFSERLNSIFQYEVFCLGMKGGQQFAFSAAVDGVGDMSVDLTIADDNALRQMLRTKGRLEDELLEDARYVRWLDVDSQRRRTNQTKMELREALLPVVFPCLDADKPEPAPADEFPAF